MTPRQEIEALGYVGEDGARLLYKLVRILAAARNFPPPEGSQTWDTAAVTETAHDFLAGEDGKNRIVDVYVSSVDDTSFRRILETAIINFLRARGRSTDTGRLIVRINDVLSGSEEFIRSEGTPLRWHSGSRSVEPNTVPDASLARAITAEPVTTPKWSSEERFAPLADLETFRRLLRTVLNAADGSMTSADLAQIIATRIHHRRSFCVGLDLDDPLLKHPVSPDLAETATSALRAASIFQGLDDRSKIVLAHFDLPVRELGPIIGVRHTQAAVLRQRLSAWLADLLAPDEDSGETAAELQRLCERWLEDRTDNVGSAFTQTHDEAQKGET